MKKIVIIGTGGNCIDILDAIFEINDAHGRPVYKCLGFLDDNEEKWGQSFHGITVLGSLQKAMELDDCSFVFGIGSASNFWKRRDILEKIGIKDDRYETIIHPTASVSRMSVVGAGTVVFQNVTITSNVTIGKHVCVLPNSIISHDDVIGDFTCVAGGVCVSGNVRVGQSCYLGSNSTIKDGVHVGDYCLIGMGSNVVRNVPENTVVVGNPAGFLRNTRPT